MSLSLNATVHVYPETELEAHRCDHDGAPVLKVGEACNDLTVFFADDATARRCAEAILAILQAKEDAHVCRLPDSISEALNSGDGSYHP